MEERDVPISQSSRKRLPENQIEQARSGETFLNRIGLDRRCIVLTGTPNTGLNSTEIAQVLATALHTRFVAPSIEGLSTLDGGHLTREAPSFGRQPSLKRSHRY
jgi:hypothetical protein